MPSANAAVKAKEMKAAQKAIIARGVPKPPKHEPKEGSVDPVSVVESSHSVSKVDPENSFNSESRMSQETQAMANVANQAAAAQVAATKTRKQIHAEEVAERKQIRDAETAKRKAERAAKEAELKAAGKGYVGSMLSLAERVKVGAYVKSMTGQLRSTDELAVALDAVPPKNVILLALEALKLDTNPYATLNVGQQSMNLRNKLRGAIKAGTLTIDTVKEIRDKNGYATAEAERAAKAEAKAAAAKKREEEKAAKANKQGQAEVQTQSANTQALNNAKAQMAAEAKEAKPKAVEKSVSKKK